MISVFDDKRDASLLLKLDFNIVDFKDLDACDLCGGGGFGTILLPRLPE